MKTYEVEMKAVVQKGGPFDRSSIRMERVRKELLDIGAVPTGSFVHSDIYMSHPWRDLAATDEALRIRCQKRMDEENGINILTYKGPKISTRSKAREEIEIELADPDGMMDILLKLGFEKVMEVRKERSFMELGEIKLCLDRIDGLGFYLEAEIMSEDIEKAEDRLLDLLSGLGLQDFERRSYLELLLEEQV